jgi:hypothetical protein
MEGVVGVFKSRADATKAMGELRHKINADSVIFLTPESSPDDLAAVPTTEAERPGIGKAITSVVGAAIGSGAGLGLGTAAASLIVPGVGTIFAIGLGAAAALGLTGAAIGAKVGKEEEAFLDTGVPRDDIGCYRRILKDGGSIVIAETDNGGLIADLREIMNRNGARPFEDVRKELQGGCEEAA